MKAASRSIGKSVSKYFMLQRVLGLAEMVNPAHMGCLFVGVLNKIRLLRHSSTERTALPQCLA
jgi:hypothetical protein